MKRIALFCICGLLFVFNSGAQPAASPTNQQSYKECEQKCPQTHLKESLWQRTVTDPIAIYTLFLTLFTGVLVIVSIWQGRSLIRAEKISKSSADAATKSADVAEKALINVESPALYPVIEVAEFAKSLGWGRGPVKPVEIRLKNVGRSPGFPGIIACTLFAGGPDESISDMHAGLFPESTLAPGEISMHFIERSIQRHDGAKISDEECASIVAGRQDVYLSGNLSYIDLFGREYWQTFCLKWLAAHKAFMAFGPSRNKRERR